MTAFLFGIVEGFDSQQQKKQIVRRDLDEDLYRSGVASVSVRTAYRTGRRQQRLDGRRSTVTPQRKQGGGRFCFMQVRCYYTGSVGGGRHLAATRRGASNSTPHTQAHGHSFPRLARINKYLPAYQPSSRGMRGCGVLSESKVRYTYLTWRNQACEEGCPDTWSESNRDIP